MLFYTSHKTFNKRFIFFIKIHIYQAFSTRKEIWHQSMQHIIELLQSTNKLSI